MKTYSIGEVARLMNLPVSTLRYYDKEGLLDQVERTDGGIRIFKDSDIRQLYMMECLKGTGMQLKDIKTFFKWCKEGDSTIEQRYYMFLERRAEVEKQMQELRNMMDMIDYKCRYYETALKAGTLDCPEVQAITHQAAKKSSYVMEVTGGVSGT